MTTEDSSFNSTKPQFTKSSLENFSLNGLSLVVKSAVKQVKSGIQIQRAEAVAAAKEILTKSDHFYDPISVCDVLGWIEVEPEVTAALTQEKLIAQQQAEQAQKELRAKEKLRLERKQAREAAEAAKRQREEEAVKERNARAEMKIQEAKASRNKTVIVTRGPGCQPQNQVNMEVGKWLANHDSIYLSGDVLCRWSESADGMVVVTDSNLGSLLCEGFVFKTVKETKYGLMEDLLSQAPPEHRRAILGTMYWPGVKHVKAVLNHPVVTPEGDVIGTTAGYDRDHKFLFHQTAAPPDVDLDQAYRDLIDVFRDFPQQSVPGALGLIFTLLMRPMLGTAPMFVVNAPAEGSGKSLLAKCCFNVIYPSDVKVLAQPKGNEDEFDKQFKGHLLAEPGSPVFLDNYNGWIDYEILKTLLTSPAGMSFRVLGTKTMFSANTRFPIVLTGCNISLGGEIDRRSIQVQIDTGREDPSKWTGYSRTSQELENHTKDSHRHLQACAIKILADALLHMSDEHKTRAMGSFETWAGSVAKAVVFCTEKAKTLGILRQEIEGDITPTGDNSAAVLDNLGEVLASIYGHKRNSMWSVHRLHKEDQILLDECLGTTNKTDQRNIRLDKRRDRPVRFGDGVYKLERAGHGKWRVHLVSGSSDPIDPESQGGLPPHMDPGSLTVN